jgi:hypothetical protein
MAERNTDSRFRRLFWLTVNENSTALRISRPPEGFFALSLVDHSTPLSEDCA